MKSPDQLRRAASPNDRLRIVPMTEPDWRFNRALYCAVGEPWRWMDKRQWSDAQWREYVSANDLQTFAAYEDEALVGYYELRGAAEIEIAYFGLLTQFIGRKLGGALLTSAVEQAWRSEPTPSRVWVHTCNRDHPHALANYLARGFVVYHVETTADDLS